MNLSDNDERDMARVDGVPTLSADITALRRVLAGVRSTACRQVRADVALRGEMAEFCITACRHPLV